MRHKQLYPIYPHCMLKYFSNRLIYPIRRTIVYIYSLSSSTNHTFWITWNSYPSWCLNPFMLNPNFWGLNLRDSHLVLWNKFYLTTSLFSRALESWWMYTEIIPKWPNYSGWWNILAFTQYNNPNWRTPSFFRGVGWNHQPVNHH